jgi:hypothetical protein
LEVPRPNDGLTTCGHPSVVIGDEWQASTRVFSIGCRNGGGPNDLFVEDEPLVIAC